MHHLAPATNDLFMERFSIFRNLPIEATGAPYKKNIAPYKVIPTAAPGKCAGTTVANFPIADMKLVSATWGAPMIGTALSDHGTFAIGIPIAGTTNVIDPYFGKIEPTHNQARLFHLDAGIKLIGSQARSVFDLALPYQVLQNRVRSFYGDEINGPLRFSPLLELESLTGRTILSLIEHLRLYALNSHGVINPLVSATMQEYVVSTVLGMLPHNYRERLSKAADCAVPRSVIRAEEFMRAAAHKPITLDAVARYAGCGERALHNAFRNFRGKTPMTVLRDIRLEGAHRDLQNGETTITDTVFKWGFTNPGRFSRLYAEKFGRKPSQTLRYGAS